MSGEACVNEGRRRKPRTGYTLVEMLIVMALLALLLSLATPKYFDSLERSKETALKADLKVMREAIDKHRGDTGRLPENLEQLVQARYLREIPIDPITDRSDSWVMVRSPETSAPGMFDVKSGAQGAARDGSPYSTW